MQKQATKEKKRVQICFSFNEKYQTKQYSQRKYNNFMMKFHHPHTQSKKYEKYEKYDQKNNQTNKRKSRNTCFCMIYTSSSSLSTRGSTIGLCFSMIKKVIS